MGPKFITSIVQWARVDACHLVTKQLLLVKQGSTGPGNQNVKGEAI